jgi:NAD(P)-dependent dehydrogenase (short-subunit alcohol dehydrogenase family)
MSTDVSKLLRPGLLDGVSIVLAGVPGEAGVRGQAGVPAGTGGPGGASQSLGASVTAGCTQLGARVCVCELNVDASPGLEDANVEQAVQEAVDRALADADSVELLVVDSASVFAAAAAGGGGDDDGGGAARVALRACLDASWDVTRAVAVRAFLPHERGGRIVYLAPSPDAGQHADAARAGLENLARTLSIEWARHGVTAVAIAPGVAAAAAGREVAALTAYLASPAGAYFSGCVLDLRGPAGG